MKRLNEIYYQQLGTRIFDDPDAVVELKITDAQKTQVAKVREENQAAMRDLFQGGGGFNEETRAKVEEARKKGDEKLMAVLTADQTKKLEELKGKPFAMPENARGRGGFGGFGGGEGGRGRGRGGNNPPPNP
jgi:Spy/CpxP family protein refolding chaperone